MAPSPIPAPLPPWAKAALFLEPFVEGYIRDLLTHESPAPSVMQWRKLMVKIENISAGAVSQDAAWCTWDLVNITGGNVDNSWTTGDYTTAEALFTTFWGSMLSKINNYGKVSEYRWYTREFNGYDQEKPFKDSGPPQRVTTVSYTGSGGGAGPSQMALTLTERTAWPKHWGRVYIPFFSPGLMTSDRIATSTVDAVGTATNTLYNGLATAELFPVVAVTQVKNDPARALLTVDHITVDNVPDVIRRRRPRNTTYRKTLP